MFEAGTIEAHSLDHALRIVADDPEPLVPLLNVAADDGNHEVFLVCDDSAKAFDIGRAQVRERGTAVRAYCLVVEATINIGGERQEALIVETGQRSSAYAVQYAQTFEAGTRRPGQLMHVENVLNAITSTSTQPLHWGRIVPCLWSDQHRTALHVANHELGSEIDRLRTIRFLRARMAHYAQHLPEGSVQGIEIDDGGQDLSEADRDLIRSELVGPAEFVRFLSEEGR